MGERRLYGEAAVEMLRDLKRQEKNLPPFKQDLLTVTKDEIVACHDMATTILDQTRNDDGEIPAEIEPELLCSLHVHYSAINRNKRCALAYLLERARRVSQLRWTHGSVLPEEVRARLSEEECQFFEQYDELLSRTMARVDLDLTANLEAPPRDLFVEVRALEDFGAVVTGSGTVTLLKNVTYLVRRSDVDHLIRTGILEVIG